MQLTNFGGADPLHRAVVISLFTWARANDSDPVDDSDLQGWWGDSFPDVANDKIGSKLWLLRRRTLTQATMNDAVRYAREALAWMIADDHVDGVDVAAHRHGIEQLRLRVTLTIGDDNIDIDFDDIWRVINHAV